jgi:hypothetical protein
VDSIADHSKALNKDSLANAFAKAYTLDLKSDQDKARLAFIKNQPLNAWINILDDNEPHLSYQDNFDKFKTMFQPFIEIHRRCISHQLLKPEELIEFEKKHFGMH